MENKKNKILGYLVIDKTGEGEIVVNCEWDSLYTESMLKEVIYEYWDEHSCDYNNINQLNEFFNDYDVYVFYGDGNFQRMNEDIEFVANQPDIIINTFATDDNDDDDEE